jgi:hypothetical protein
LLRNFSEAVGGPALLAAARQGWLRHPKNHLIRLKKHKHPTLSIQETRGTIAKLKKAALGNPVPPTFCDLRKNDVSVLNKICFQNPPH